MNMVAGPRIVTLLLLLCASCASARGATASPSSEKARTMLTYDLRLEQDTIMLEEGLSLRLTLTNPGDTLVEVPDPSAVGAQPTYTLEGPAHPSGWTFSRASLEASPFPTSAPVQDTRLLRLAPGATWEGRVHLETRAQLSAPGEYQLTSRLEGVGVTGVSPRRSFRVTVLPASVHVGFGSRPLGRGEGLGAFIQQGTDASRLYSFAFVETRPDIGEAHLDSPVFRSESRGPAATDIGVPWRNSPFYDELIKWLVWRQERTLHALSDTGVTATFALPEEPDFLVRPPLKTRGGPVEVLVVSQNGRTLSLVRFPFLPDGAPSEPVLAWSVPLPAVPLSMTAALGPAGKGSERHIAFVASGPSGLGLFHARFGANGPPSPFVSMRLDTARALEGASPALFVDRQGSAWFSVLALTDGEGLSCARVDASFARKGRLAASPRVTPLGSLPTRPTGGALLYVEDKGALARHEAVILLADGRLLRSNAALQLEPASVAGKPVEPLLLLPGQHVTYVLYSDPLRGLYVEPLQ